MVIESRIVMRRIGLRRILLYYLSLSDETI